MNGSRSAITTALPRIRAATAIWTMELAGMPVPLSIRTRISAIRERVNRKKIVGGMSATTSSLIFADSLLMASDPSVVALHRRREPILAEIHTCGLQCSIRLLRRRGDEYLGSRHEFTPVAHDIGDNRRIRRDDDLLLSVLVLQCERLPIDPGDRLLDVGVRHGALGPKIPRAVPFTGAAH